MRRKYVAYAALLAIFMLLFTGCDALVGNLFKTANLGQPSAEKIKELDATALLAESGISTGSVSGTFIDTILSDETGATKDAVIATLEATVAEGTAEEAQAAEALILDIKLADIGADEVVNNLGGAIADLAGGSGDVNPEDIFNALLPADLTSDLSSEDGKKNLADFIDSIDALGTDVDTLAAKIDANSGKVADGLDVATMAQTAAIVKFVNVVEPAGGYSTGEALANAVADLKKDSEADVTKYFAAEPDFSSLVDDAALQTLFTAAGMDELLDQFSGS
jgi:hypothetical protein